MSATNYGGPAFPSNDDGIQNDGMTLRDWFAGKALVGLLSEPKATAETPDRYAKAAYIFADAMLKARGGTP